ncbi:MAG: acyltransferase family protein [Acidimicrobiales bacterium]|jgi:peptidoglycan/LPS O-acetylase OafA/YrhL
MTTTAPVPPSGDATPPTVSGRQSPVGHHFRADALGSRPSATGSARVLGLDGLRAVAVVLVLGFHFGVGWLDGGFFGVDVFFVLSGYLITGLLLGEFERRGRIGLGGFWLRRARRLLPALVVVIVVVSLLVRLAEPSGTFPGYRMDALSALFYFSNWWQVATSGNYFAAVGAVPPLTHTWSLAVEEQFYLVWPLVVLAVMRLSRSFARGVRVLLAVAVVGAAASAAEMALLFHPGTDTTRIYFGTDTHAQSVLVGAALACALTIVDRRRGLTGMDPVAETPAARRWLVGAGMVGMAVILVLSRLLGGASAVAYRGGFLVVAVSAAAVILAVVSVPGGVPARVLSVPALVWLGSVSYGVYLWHFPVAVFVDGGRTGLSGPALLALRSVVTVAVAAASFYLIERPVIEGRFWRSVRAIGPAAVALAVAVAVVVATTAAAGASSTSPGSVAGLVGAPATSAEWQAVHLTSFAGAGHRLKVLIVGDSLALTVAVGIAPFARAYGIDLGGRSHTGCGVAIALPLYDHGVIGDPFTNCPTWPTWWADDVRQLHPQVVGLVIGFWEVVDRYYQGRWQHLGDPAFDAYETAQLDRAVAILGSGGAEVALFTAPYFSTGEQPDGRPWPQDATSRVDELNRIMEDVARSDPGRVAVIPLHEFLDPHGHFTWTIEGKVVRQGDGVHTTLAAGAYLAPRVLPLLAALGHSQTKV